MAWKRLILLVVVLVALVVLTVQNLSPSLQLVFLASRTQALPLAFWLLSAIALGSLTTILITLLTPRPARQGWRRRPAGFSVPPQDVPPDPTQAGYRRDREANRQSYESNYGFSAASAPRSDSDYDSGYDSGYRSDSRSAYEPDYRPDSANDSWSQSTRPKTTNPVNQAGRKLSDWMSNWGQFSRRQYMDWDERDRGLEEWEDWDGYENLNRPQPPRDEFDELEDLERDRNSVYSAPQSPPRDYERRDEPRSYEVSQEPEETYRSGSVYSYSYHKAGDDSGHVDNIYDRSADHEPDAVDPETVYDADYRVITPPQYPDDQPDTPPEDYSNDYSSSDYSSAGGDYDGSYISDLGDDYSDRYRAEDTPQANASNQEAESWEDWDSFIERKQQDDR